MVNGKKMSKSANNFYTVNDLIRKGYSSEAIRYEFLKAHYRAVLDFQESNMAGNQSVIDRLGNFITRLQREATGSGWDGLSDALKRAQNDFEAGMDDDLNMPEALAAIFMLMTEVNKNFNALSSEDAKKVLELMYSFDSVLALLPAISEETLTPEQQDLINRRQEARINKDWATADALKQELLAQGIEVKDTPQGPVWRIIKV
jgi:cysteinyl-tRNA synthetase